jgi:hypothetical protein
VVEWAVNGGLGCEPGVDFASPSPGERATSPADWDWWRPCRLSLGLLWLCAVAGSCCAGDGHVVRCYCGMATVIMLAVAAAYMLIVGGRG